MSDTTDTVTCPTCLHRRHGRDHCYYRDCIRVARAVR